MSTQCSSCVHQQLTSEEEVVRTNTIQCGTPKANISSTGKRISCRNLTQMLRNMLIGPAITQGMYLRMKMKLIQERNTAKAPICHCQGLEHQHALSNHKMKMVVEIYKGTRKQLSKYLKYLVSLFTNCTSSKKSPKNERMHKIQVAAVRKFRSSLLCPNVAMKRSLKSSRIYTCINNYIFNLVQCFLYISISSHNKMNCNLPRHSELVSEIKKSMQVILRDK